MVLHQKARARGTCLRNRHFTGTALTGGIALLAAGALVPGIARAQGLPEGGSVTAGAAVIHSPSGDSLVIDQASARAILAWQGFSIGQGKSVTFNNGSGATLNRVTGPLPSPPRSTVIFQRQGRSI
ncbi:hypothetical protein [Rhodospirillum sp. A1_3_36]|uniref:two-partner secretion domain-containing protein n=1 Tax=Rhodospirillum sp. A1_3_36 TaxID=3391666 RepID=UPI0039A438E5